MRPASNPNDISFTLFGFPTTVQPFFWIVAGLITASSIGAINNDMPMWIAQLVLGMVGVLLSILVHELGHALTFRYLYHTPCTIVLHSFGGMAVPLHHYARGYGFSGAAAHCFLSFSGPLAGFILALVMLVCLQVVPPEVVLLRFFLRWTMFISIFWGIFNLLPVYPMDGGHIAREICMFFSPRRGIRYSLILSMTLSALLAVLALQYELFIMTLFFAYFAYQNYQEMTFGSLRR